jgi:hypothetical protein
LRREGVHTARPRRRPPRTAFSVNDLDILLAKVDQRAIRKLKTRTCKPPIDAHLATGESWWTTARRQTPNIAGGHRIARSRLGWVNSCSVKRCCADSMRHACSREGNLPLPWRRHTYICTAKEHTMILEAVFFCAAILMHYSIDG